MKIYSYICYAKQIAVRKYLPILEWLPNYRQEYFQGDLIAGLTVGVMLIPQGMAYAMLAGLPPVYGLYTSIVPLLVYAILGTSRQLAVGPVAMMSLLILTGVGAIATPGSETYIELAIILALMVGVIQLSMGLFRLGFLVSFLSHPVISGFTSAAALIIAFSQLKHLLGLELPRTIYIHQVLMDALASFSEINLPTLLIGSGGILLILLAKRINRSIPGPLIAVAFGIVVVYAFGLDQAGVRIVREIPQGLPGLTIPAIDLQTLRQLLPAALTIALIGFMESIAVAKAIQARHKSYQVDANQELIGLGMASAIGSFFSSFPAAGGFGRTAVNEQSGAKSGIASAISALLVTLTLLFLTPLFYYLPQAILASVIMVAVIGLVDVNEVINLWKTDRTDFFMLLATFVFTLGLGIEVGIAVGVVLSLVMVLYRSAYPHVASLGQVPQTSHYRNVNRFTDVVQRDDVLVMRFDAPLFFANSGYFQEYLEKLIKEKGQSLKLIVLNAEPISGMDSTAVHMLSDLIPQYKSKGIEFYLTSVIGPVRDILYKSGLVKVIGEDHLFVQVHDAIEHFDRKTSDPTDRLQNVATQTNIDPEKRNNL